MDVPLNYTQLDHVVQAIADRLDGDWLLIGGALAALWFDSERVTEDVDLMSLSDDARRLELMRLASDLGLPVESVNSAADFFVRRIEGWADGLVPFRNGARGTIYRPDVNLFLVLKMQRLSEQDLSDCLALLELECSSDEPLDVPRITQRLDELPASEDGSVQERRARLRRALTTSR